MQDKIQELADQCWSEGFHISPGATEKYEAFDYDKFAKMIVNECAKICDSHDSVDAILISNLIRRKFGI